MDKEKNFKKYVGAVAGRNMMIIFLVIGILFMFAAGPAVFIAMGVFALIGLIMWLTNNSRFNKKIEALKESGYWETMLADFEQATAVVNDKVRAGQHFIYGKHSGMFYTYNEICWLYRFTQRYMFIPISSNAMIGSSNGKIIPFCRIKANTKAGNAQIQELAQMVYSKNSNVILGYDVERQKQFRAMTKK